MALNSSNATLGLDEVIGNSTRLGQSEIFDPLTYCLIIVFLAAVGVVGNCLNIVIFSLKHNRKESLSVYMRTVAVSDSVVLILEIMECSVTRLKGFHILYGNITICPIILFTQRFWPLLSSALVVAIAVDRYVAVVYPSKRASMCTNKRATWTVIGITISCACLSLPEVIWDSVETNAIGASTSGVDYQCPVLHSYGATHHMVMIMYSLLFVVAIPFAVAMGLNVRGYWLLRASQYVSIHQKKTAPEPSAVSSLPVIGLTSLSIIFLLPIHLVEMAEFDFNWVKGWPWLQENIDIAWDTTNVIRLLHYAINFYFSMCFFQSHRKALREAFSCHKNSKDSVTSKPQEADSIVKDVTNMFNEVVV